MRNISLAERVCESFFSDSLTEAIVSVQNLKGIGELRYDLSTLNLNELATIKESSAMPLLFTCRTHQIRVSEATKAYQKAIDLGYDYIDIDFFIDGKILEHLHSLKNTKLILSYHNYDGTPPKYKLITILDELKAAKPHIIKMATLLRSEEDIQILEELQTEYKNAIVIGMGEWAISSRIRSLRAGAPFTYIALYENQSTAKGQVGFKCFQQEYLKFRGKETIKLAVLGNPIAHSKSPDLFKTFFYDEEVIGVYEKIELENIGEIEILKKHYDGFNVTAPFKQSMIPYLDELSEAAQKIGAVNTVYKKNGKWNGDNTDFKGILEAIRSRSDLSKIQKCLILGAGGAARAAAYAMKQTNIPCFVINRTYGKAVQLANDFNVYAIEEAPLQDIQLIINTIPEPFSIISPEELTPHHIVLDAIYPKSAFARPASEIGFILIRGEVWLKEQALEAYRIFSNIKY